MKKTIAIVLVILCLLSINTVFATETNKLENNNQNEVTEIKDKMKLKEENNK